MSSYIMVLQVGETYTSLDGCAIIMRPDHVADAEIEEFLSRYRRMGVGDDNRFAVVTVFGSCP